MTTSTVVHTADGTLVELSVQDILVGSNVRDLNEQHVEQLAGSIKMLGVLVPLVVARQDDGFHLVAGHHRLEAAKRAGLTLVPVHQRDGVPEQGGTDTDTAVENILRKELTPYEEALAVKRAIDSGLTTDGAAQALGWTPHLVTLRLRVFDMPEPLRAMVGVRIALGDVDTFARIHHEFPKLGNMLAEAATTEGIYDEGRFAPEARTIEGIGQHPELVKKHGVFVWHVESISEYSLRDIGVKLKKAAQEKFDKIKPKDSYSRVSVPIITDQIDQLRAMGVLIEIDSEYRGMQYLVVDEADKKLIKQTIDDAIKVYVPPRAETTKKAADGKERTPAQQAKLEANRERRAMAHTIAEAHSRQRIQLLDKMASIDVDMDVARFFVYGLFGVHERHTSFSEPSLGVELWNRGLDGVLMPTLEAQPAKKNGEMRPSKVVYEADHKRTDKPDALVKFLEGAKTPGDLFGRALCVIAGADLCIPGVLAQAKQWNTTAINRNSGTARAIPGSYGSRAAKAYDALVKRHKVVAPELDAAVKEWKKIAAGEKKAAAA